MTAKCVFERNMHNLSPNDLLRVAGVSGSDIKSVYWRLFSPLGTSNTSRFADEQSNDRCHDIDISLLCLNEIQCGIVMRGSSLFVLANRASSKASRVERAIVRFHAFFITLRCVF